MNIQKTTIDHIQTSRELFTAPTSFFESIKQKSFMSGLSFLVFIGFISFVLLVGMFFLESSLKGTAIELRNVIQIAIFLLG